MLFSTITRLHIPPALALLVSAFLCPLLSPAQPPQSDTAAPKTAATEPPSQTPPRPNPKRARKAAELGDKALADGHTEKALAYYDEAVRYAPQDTDIVERFASLRSRLVRDHADAAERDALAGRADMATEELAKALLIDPGNTIVAERMAQMKAMQDRPPGKLETKFAGLPELQPRPGKQNLDLRGDTQTVYQQLAAAFGVRVSFDPDLPARNVRLRLESADFATAVKVLSLQTGTFFQAITSSIFFVALDSPEKRREYASQAEQTFALPSSIETSEMTEMVRLLREMTNATHLTLDAASRSITIRAAPEDLALAAEIIRQTEKTRGEILLEIEILEVDANKARTLGLLPPSSAKLIPLAPGLLTQLQQAKDISTLITLLASIFGNGGSAASASAALSSLIPPLTLVGGGKTSFLLTLPAAAAQFSDALTLVRSGRQVLLRAQDGKPATFFVGDRFPITLSLLSGSLGTTTFTPGPTNSILPSTSYNVGVGPVALAAADFRANGLFDLAVVNEIDNTLTILANQGSGTFVQAAGSPILLGAARASAPAVPPAIASATFNSTGFADLLITDPVANSVTLLLSNGDDTFKAASAAPIAVGNRPSAIVTGDFNADGDQDFVVTNFTDNTFSVFLGNGDGTFRQATGSPFALPSGVAGPIAIVATDFNGDGKPDLAIVNQTTNNVSILLGNGDGTFKQATNSPIAAGKSPVAIAAGDVNGDSHPDIAVVNQADSSVSVLLGNGDGTFSAALNSPLATGQGPTGIAIADFNGDGNQDIAVTAPATDSVAVFLGLGHGLFAPAFELPVGINPTTILAAPLAAGALPDVAITDDPAGTAGQVTVILSPASLFSNAGTSGSGVAQQPYPGAQYEDIGVKIKATPSMHANDEVTLQLDFEIRALSGTNINGIPIISNRSLSQTVRVKEGEATIIGGLLDNQETRTLTGLPGFANLPGGLSFAFSQRNTTAQNTEMLILVTPRTLRLRDRVSRAVYAGRATTSGRASLRAPFPSER